MLALLRRLVRFVRIALAARRVRIAPEHTREVARRALTAQLGDARGLPMKVGQILAGMGDEGELADLTRSVEPLPLASVKPLLARALGRPLEEVFQRIEESQSAASLGQVHRAELLDGTPVAVKVQYPDIASAIGAELTLAGMLPSAGPMKRWGFDLNAYKATLRDNMARELDYAAEARQQARFAEQVRVAGLHVPTPHLALSGPTVLVQEWVSGARLGEAAAWPLGRRLHLGRTLMQTLFQSLFEAGLVHGDPHPGNLLAEPSGERGATLHLLDFGCVVEVAPERRLALLKLILAARGECHVNTLDAFAALGFDAAKLAHIGDALPKLLPVLFRPFVEERPFDTKAWALGADFGSLLGEHRWWFRSAGPSDLLLLMRAFQGLVKQLELLDVRLPWWPLLQQCVSSERVQQALTWTPPHVGQAPRVAEGLAKALRVRVTVAGESRVDAAMPASEALCLADLVPDHVRAAIQAQGTRLEALQRQITERGLVPQALFDVSEGDARYEGWLE